jgi:hypothetical protein
MPSEQRVDLVLSALQGSLEGFRSAVARAVDEVRAELERRRQPAGAAPDAQALGALASRIMDPERFAGLFAEDSLLDPEAYALLERAHEALASLDAADDRMFVESVLAGGSLREAVDAGLGRLGIAFGAARAAELAREGRYRTDAHAEHLSHFPPASWNRAERGLAPPLVVPTPGVALRAGALAEFLDGAQKLVLVIEGTAPPASLVRLITPGVLVLQTEDPEALHRLSDFEGPAVAALFPEGSGSARFTHDPSVGSCLAERMAVEELPEVSDLRPVGAISAAQQAEELAQLASLARPGAPAAAVPSTNGHSASGGGDAARPADRLAAWLLRQANLRDLG